MSARVPAPTIVCRCGMDSGVPTPPSGYSVGELAKATGFWWVMLYDGDSVWICPSCYSKAYYAARVIEKVVGSDSVSLVSFSRAPASR